MCQRHLVTITSSHCTLVSSGTSILPKQGPMMAGITLLLDLWRKNQGFNSATRTYQSSWFFSASATAASFAAGTTFASKDFFGFRTPVAYCDAGAAISEDYIPTTGSVPEKYFYHDILKYTTTKHYNIELKPLSSAFELRTFGLITLRSFLMFYLPLLEPHAKMEQDDDDVLPGNQDDLRSNLSVPFKKSLLQFVREVTVLTTRRILERISVHYLSRRMAWKLLKDVPQSAARKAGRRMPKLVYFFSVTRTTFRGHMLAIAASWLVQVGIRLCQFSTSMCKKEDDNVDKSEKITLLRQKVFLATIKCNASLVFASIGAGIGATLFRPSAGQWIGCAIGDLAGPVIVAVTVLTTKRILERISVHYLSRRMAWKLLKDVPQSAARKAGRRMPKLVYFFSVSRTTFRGHMLAIAASWLVQVSIRLCQFSTSMCKKEDDNVDKSEKITLLRQKVFLATVKCNASLVFASIGAGIGATLFRPSAGQWIGCAIGDLAGPVIVAVCADKIFHLNL